MAQITPCDLFVIMARLPGGWVAFRYLVGQSCRIMLMKGTYAVAGTGLDLEAASEAVARRVDSGMDGPTGTEVLGAIVTTLAASYRPNRYLVDDQGLIAPIREPNTALPN